MRRQPGGLTNTASWQNPQDIDENRWQSCAASFNDVQIVPVSLPIIILQLFGANYRFVPMSPVFFPGEPRLSMNS